MRKLSRCSDKDFRRPSCRLTIGLSARAYRRARCNTDFCLHGGNQGRANQEGREGGRECHRSPRWRRLCSHAVCSHAACTKKSSARWCNLPVHSEKGMEVIARWIARSAFFEWLKAEAFKVCFLCCGKKPNLPQLINETKKILMNSVQSICCYNLVFKRPISPSVPFL